MEIQENGIEVARYFYDENSRLIREDNKKLDKTFFYEYDRGGNIVRKIITTTETDDEGVAKDTVNSYVYTSLINIVYEYLNKFVGNLF